MIIFQSGVELFQYALIGEEEMTVMMSQCQWQGGEGPDKQEQLRHSQSVWGGNIRLSFSRKTVPNTGLIVYWWQKFERGSSVGRNKGRATMSFFQRIGSIVENVKVGSITFYEFQ